MYRPVGTTTYIMSATPSAEDINLIASFLGQSSISSLQECHPVDCIVLCICQVLLQAETVLKALEHNPALTKVLIVVGGIGHSTQAIYDAVANHPQYHVLLPKIQGLPESRVIEQILLRLFDVTRITSQGCKILYEDKSTNCGSNAVETRRLLEAAKIETPRSFLIVQDPTMLRRTMASFEKVYADQKPTLLGYPVFVPTLKQKGDELKYTDLIPGAWPISRLTSLVIGEIPRMRDDANGYGPRGKGFIAHVDIPADVEAVYDRASKAVGQIR